MSVPVRAESALRLRRTLILALLAVLPAAPLLGQGNRAAAATKVATVEGITEYTLPNGLRVLLFPDPSKPTATVNVTYMVGSRHEGYGETGMAHLLEHLVFKGTPNHPNIPQELTEHGTRPNGSTWFDRTNYFETFTATDANLVWALDLEADRMVNSFIAKKDLESEMTVVRNEFEMGENSPFSVLMERTLSTAFLWHNYGNSTIGARADLENVPIERLQAFYRKYYQPDNAMLVVAGKFDPASTLLIIEQKFGAIPRPDRSGANQLYSTYTAEPTQDGERAVTLRRVGDVQVLMAAYHVPAGSHQDFAAIDVLAEVLGSEPAGRLYKALVETRKAAQVGAFSFQLREPGVLLTFAQVRQDGSLDSARAALDAALTGVVATPPTEEEVARAKLTLVKNIELSLNSSDRIGLQLSEWGSMGDWRLLFLHRDRIREVTAEDVLRVAQAYLRPSNRTLGTFIPTPAPERSVIPEMPDVAALVKDYRGDSTRSVGEAFDPSTANIDQRTARFSLPSGLKVALLPKETRGASVNVRLALRFGSEQSLMHRETAGDLAGDMLMRGTRQHTRQQIKDEFDRLKARASVAGTVSGAFASIETTSDHLPAVLRLVGEVLRETAFDPKEFEELRQERLAQLEEQKSEPTMLGSIAFSRHLNPWPKGHPRYVATLEEQVQALTDAKLEDARKFHQDFYGLGAGELAIVGQFDTTAVRRAVEEAFGVWKSPAQYARLRSMYRNVAPANQSIETPDKANGFMLAGENLPLRDDDPAYPALVLGNYMLGGGFLNSRLAVRIRQKEGLSYGVGSGLNANPLDSAGLFQVYAIFAPENVDKVELAMREEIARALAEGFTPEEVQAAKEGYLQSRQVSRSQDRELAGTLANGLYVGRTMSWDADVERRIQALTPIQIRDALRRFIDPAKLTVVKAGDFAGKKKTEPAQP